MENRLSAEDQGTNIVQADEEDMTTIEVFDKDHPTWRRCCKKKNLSSKEVFHDLMNTINNKIAFDTYCKSLASRDDFKRPLKGVTVRKELRYAKTIEK